MMEDVSGKENGRGMWTGKRGGLGKGGAGGQKRRVDFIGMGALWREEIFVVSM